MVEQLVSMTAQWTRVTPEPTYAAKKKISESRQVQYCGSPPKPSPCLLDMDDRPAGLPLITDMNAVIAEEARAGRLRFYNPMDTGQPCAL